MHAMYAVGNPTLSPQVLSRLARWMLDVAGGYRRYFGPKGFKQTHALVEIVRQPLVIGVEKSNEFAARLRDPRIACRAGPGVRLTNQAEARVRILLRNRCTIIGRAVIDDDCFKVSERLRRNRVERPPHVRRFVVKRNDN